MKRLEEVEEELYPSCTKFSKVSFIFELYQLKYDSYWSNKSFGQFVELLDGW